MSLLTANSQTVHTRLEADIQNGIMANLVRLCDYINAMLAIDHGRRSVHDLDRLLNRFSGAVDQAWAFFLEYQRQMISTGCFLSRKFLDAYEPAAAIMRVVRHRNTVESAQQKFNHAIEQAKLAFAIFGLTVEIPERTNQTHRIESLKPLEVTDGRTMERSANGEWRLLSKTETNRIWSWLYDVGMGEWETEEVNAFNARMANSSASSPNTVVDSAVNADSCRSQ